MLLFYADAALFQINPKLRPAALCCKARNAAGRKKFHLNASESYSLFRPATFRFGIIRKHRCIYLSWPKRMFGFEFQTPGTPLPKPKVDIYIYIYIYICVCVSFIFLSRFLVPLPSFNAFLHKKMFDMFFKMIIFDSKCCNSPCFEHWCWHRRWSAFE